jgi:uncharacterized protein YciI
MPTFLYQLHATRPEMLSIGSTPEEDAIVSEHFDHLKVLTEQGVMLFVGRTLNTDPSCFGIAIFEADSEERARQIMSSDPAVKKGVMRAELFPFRIALVGDLS